MLSVLESERVVFFGVREGCLLFSRESCLLSFCFQRVVFRGELTFIFRVGPRGVAENVASSCVSRAYLVRISCVSRVSLVILCVARMSLVRITCVSRAYLVRISCVARYLARCSYVARAHHVRISGCSCAPRALPVRRVCVAVVALAYLVCCQHHTCRSSRASASPSVAMETMILWHRRAPTTSASAAAYRSSGCWGFGFRV